MGLGSTVMPQYCIQLYDLYQGHILSIIIPEHNVTASTMAIVRFITQNIQNLHSINKTIVLLVCLLKFRYLASYIAILTLKHIVVAIFISLDYIVFY